MKHICAECNCVFDDPYYMVMDNFLQYHYFDAIDEGDNKFCSFECVSKALSIETVYGEFE